MKSIKEYTIDELRAIPADRKTNELIAECLEIRPCSAWIPINMGSAGGLMLHNRGCAHKPGMCYSDMADTQVMFGTLGGPDDYSGSINMAFKLVPEHSGFQLFRFANMKYEKEPVRLDEPTWTANISRPETGSHIGAMAHSPSLAICRAFLIIAHYKA